MPSSSLKRGSTGQQVRGTRDRKLVHHDLHFVTLRARLMTYWTPSAEPFQRAHRCPQSRSLQKSRPSFSNPPPTPHASPAGSSPTSSPHGGSPRTMRRASSSPNSS